MTLKRRVFFNTRLFCLTIFFVILTGYDKLTLYVSISKEIGLIVL
jgi:hypothetical protein